LVKFYSTHCPKCKILEKKLQDNNIDYEEINDENEMIAKGFMSVPMLEVNGKVMGFAEAIKWVNGKSGR
jgi:glutaredoxin